MSDAIIKKNDGLFDKFAFSLIELMIVMLIIAILAIVAYPTYTQHLYKSRRVHAKAALLDYQESIERCYSKQFNYQTCTTMLLQSTVNIALNNKTAYYEIRVIASDISMYQLAATAKLTKNTDTLCYTLLINKLGMEIAKDINNSDTTSLCW